MKRKNMAHPMLRRNTKLGQFLTLITMAIVLAFTVLVNSISGPSSVSANVVDQNITDTLLSAASASNCTSGMKSITKQDAAKQAVTELRGPAYATIWVNYNAVPSDAAWNIARKNPSWGQKEVKIKIPWGVEVNAYWAGGTFVRYSRNADCQLKMTRDYNADTRPAKTLDEMRQWGLISYFHIGKK